jgi:hypothetical protein
VSFFIKGRHRFVKDTVSLNHPPAPSCRDARLATRTAVMSELICTLTDNGEKAYCCCYTNGKLCIVPAPVWRAYSNSVMKALAS